MAWITALGIAGYVVMVIAKQAVFPLCRRSSIHITVNINARYTPENGSVGTASAALRTRGVRIFVSGDFLHRANLLRLGAALLRVYLPGIVSRRGDLALSLCCLVRCVQSVLRVYHKL